MTTMTRTAEPRTRRITRDSLLTLEAYAKTRQDFRARVLAHKKPRTVHLGDHVTLLFEDELTVRYQIQEMLRIEKTFEDAGIQDELDAYNPLIPDGRNWKATMLVEFEDVDERRRRSEEHTSELQSLRHLVCRLLLEKKKKKKKKSFFSKNKKNKKEKKQN